MSKWTERKIKKALEYRTPKEVTSYYSYDSGIYGTMVFELCPACNNAIERTYQSYCSECGQKLKWSMVRAKACVQDELNEKMDAKAMED